MINISETINKIPSVDPDIKIGSLNIWILGYTNEDQKGLDDYIYLDCFFMLNTKDVIVLSPGSDTYIGEMKALTDKLSYIYETIGIENNIEFQFQEAEFKISLSSNKQGQLNLVVTYESWLRDGSFEFEETIDQSYLPKMINTIKDAVKKWI